jgi:tetratricopeptide (TPR) repeat protein
MAGSEIRLFDRELEKKAVRDFLQRTDKSFLLLTGESGVGKSTLTYAVCMSELGIEGFRRFSFKGGTGLGYASLRDFLSETYKNCRAGGSLKLPFTINSVTLGFSYVLTASTSFSTKKTKIDSRYIMQFCKVLHEKGYQAIVVQNTELVSEQDDFEIIATIIDSKHLPLKFIFEFGSLKPSQRTLKSFLENAPTVHRLTIAPFGEDIARTYYGHIHRAPAPSDLMLRTRGLPLLIEQKRPLDYSEEAISAAAASIEALPVEQSRLLALIYVCGGSVRISFVQEILDSGNVDDEVDSLVFKRIIVTRDGFAQFRHHAFYLYFDELAEDDVIFRMRESVCKLAGELRTRPTHELIIIGSNAISLGKEKLADGLLQRVLSICFERASFGAIARLFEAASRRGVSIQGAEVRYQVAQSYVLLGDGGSAYDVLQSHLAQSDPSVIVNRLVLAQAQYEANLFEASNETIKSVIFDCSEKLAVVAHGQLASNAIALGSFDAAREHYTVARDIARNLGDMFLEFEVIRLSPKIHDKSIAIAELRDVEHTLLPRRFPLTFAKCMHNRGVARLLRFRDVSGVADIIVAKNIFESYQAHIVTYSLMMQGLIAMIERKYNDAEAIMLDALNLAINRYERFSLLSNLGAISLLTGDVSAAETRFRDAKWALRSGARPLLDPDLVADAEFNLALIAAITGRFAEAKDILDGVAIPSTTSFYTAVQQRLNWLNANIREKRKIIELRVGTSVEPDWLIREFRCALSTLSFYDFSINISVLEQF